MSRRRSILYSALLLTAANLAMRVVSMMFQVYLSRQVGAAGIGLLQLTMTVGTLAITIGTSGVRVASMYLCAEEHGRKRSGGVKRAMTNCIIYGLIVSSAAGAAVVVFSGYIARVWILDVRAASSLKIIGLFLPVSCLWGVMGGYFTAVGKIGRLVAVEIAERLVSILITIVLLLTWVGGDTERACCAIVGGSSLASTLSLVLIWALYLHDRRQMGRVPRDLHMGHRLIRLAVPLALNEYLRSGLSTLEHLLIPRGLSRASGSYEQSISAYGAIHGMVFPVLMFPACVLYSLSDLLVPELAGCTAAGRGGRIRYLTNRCLRMALLFACACAGVMYCAAAPLGQLLYRSDEAGHYLLLFAPLVPMLYLDAIVDGMHKGLGQQVQCVRYNTITSLLDVLLLIFLLPRCGIGGYFFSFTASHAVNFYLSIARLLKVTGYSPSLRFTLKAAFCTLAAGAATLLFASGFPVASLLGAVLLYGGAYLGMFSALVFLTGALRKEDARWLLSALRPNSSAAQG